MTPKEALDLITDIQSDYIAMVREMNKVKRMVTPVDPWKLPLVLRMEKAKADLRLASGIGIRTST